MADPIGAVRAIDGHVFVRLHEPADEPWHIVYSAGQQTMSGWQSDEDMKGATGVGYLPIKECVRGVQPVQPAPSSSDAPNQTATLMAALIEQELELAHSGEGYEPKAVAEEIVKDHVVPRLEAKDAEIERLRTQLRNDVATARTLVSRLVDATIGTWFGWEDPHHDPLIVADQAVGIARERLVRITELRGELEAERAESDAIRDAWHYHLRARLNGVYGALAGQGNELAGELRAAIGFLDESVGQLDTEATGQVSERDAALHEALQEDEETLLADTIEQASIPATPTGVAVVELDADDPLAQRVEHDSRMDGVDTPGCDCGHSGMGEGWHSSDCTWKQTPAAPAEPRVWSFDDDEPDGVTTVTTPGGAEFNRGEDGRWHSEQVMHGYGFHWNDLVEGYPFVTEVFEDGGR